MNERRAGKKVDKKPWERRRAMEVEGRNNHIKHSWNGIGFTTGGIGEYLLRARECLNGLLLLCSGFVSPLKNRGQTQCACYSVAVDFFHVPLIFDTSWFWEEKNVLGQAD